jgi:hypothetical protein
MSTNVSRIVVIRDIFENIRDYIREKEWQRNQLSRGQKRNQSLSPALFGAVFGAAANAVICALLIYAAFVFGSWRIKERYPELKKHLGDLRIKSRMSANVFRIAVIRDAFGNIRDYIRENKVRYGHHQRHVGQNSKRVSRGS